VDNNSTDNTKEIVSKYMEGLNLVYVYEPRLGLSNARNVGYRKAQAPYVAFIDAHGMVDSTWMKNILKVIEAEKPDVLGGPYYPWYISSKPKWWLDEYHSLYHGGEPRYLDSHEYLSGTNMVWRKELLHRLGGFDSRLGVVGSRIRVGEETSLLNSARNMNPNLKVYYDPEIIVYHLTRPHVMSLLYQFKRAFISGRCHNEIFGVAQDKLKDVFPTLFYETINILYKGIIGWMNCYRREYPYIQNYLLKSLSPHFYNLGRASQGVIEWHKKHLSFGIFCR
jgi:glycosyltransferase involved in cell wall biosynthesis